jgi:hypothetical protein
MKPRLRAHEAGRSGAGQPTAHAQPTKKRRPRPRPSNAFGSSLPFTILRGTRDPDSQAAGKEFADFSKFVKENEQLLSPGAKKVFAAYEKAAKAAQAKGETGLNPAEYQKMSREMLLLTFFPQR